MDKNRDRKLGRFAEPCYKELVELFESMALAKTLTDNISAKVNIIPSNIGIIISNYDILVYEVGEWYHKTYFKIKLPHLKTENPIVEISFKDDPFFKSSGIKGNLKREGFKWNSKITFDGSARNYEFTLEPEEEVHIKQIKRLLRYFRKYF